MHATSSRVQLCCGRWPLRLFRALSSPSSLFFTFNCVIESQNAAKPASAYAIRLGSVSLRWFSLPFPVSAFIVSPVPPLFLLMPFQFAKFTARLQPTDQEAEGKVESCVHLPLLRPL